jgi:predicted branched-subunit amino acid permease
VAAAIAPLGFALGAALGATGAPRAMACLSAPLMVAGASQLALVTRVDAGASAATAAIAAVLVNIRFAIYGAAMATRFAGQPRWFRLLGAHYVVDQTYALVGGIGPDDLGASDFRRYFTTAGSLLALLWTASVGAGVIVGPSVPGAVPMELVMPAMFVGMIAPQVHRREDLIAVLFGALAAIGGVAP